VPYQVAQVTVGTAHDHHGVQQGSAWQTLQLHGSGAVQQTGRHAYERQGVRNGSAYQYECPKGRGAHQTGDRQPYPYGRQQFVDQTGAHAVHTGVRQDEE
jgi:hypothetical protein